MNKTIRTFRTDGEATYNRILETAGQLFAKTGFAETNSKTIAKKAGVDLASINYHFQNRDGLYQAVLAEAHRHFISMDVLQKASATHLSARTKLKKVIEAIVETTIGQKSWHMQVLGREFLSPSAHFQTFRKNEVFPKAQILLGILSEITAIPPDHPALLRCIIYITAPCAMLLIAGHNFPKIENTISNVPSDALAAHLYHFAIGGLKSIAREYLRSV